MKIVVNILFFMLCAGMVSAQKSSIDAVASTVQWKGYKVTGMHEGTIKVKDGTFDFENGVLKGGSINMDMTSIQCSDLSGEYKGKLEGHLKSDDFFGVATFPTASIVFKKVTPYGKVGDYRIVADLTIKGTTKEIKFNATVLNGNGSAEIKVDRADFNVRYGSGSFIDNLGDKTIYDEFDIIANLKY